MLNLNYTLILLIVIAMLLSLLSNLSWVVEFSITNLGLLSMSFSFLLEKESASFILTVLLIFLMVFLYSFSYLSGEVFLKRFLSILTLFVSSMCILILSSNLFSSLIGWDGLGVTSLYLILFYYSKSALKASTLTFLMNRVGDCFFILTITQVMLLGSSQICYSCGAFSQSVILLMILTSITKSAQIPFSTWLPAAMEAPTPVSALVHSSTLVTAGIYLLYRYKVIWVDSNLSLLLMVLSVSTCFMAALSALVENDLKKLIALSTLSQLGFIMFSFSLGLTLQGFLHMLMHAYFKALLFMCAGLVIHSFGGSQSILDMSLSKNQNPLLMMIMSCSFMSMSGLPFLSGFYSKDLILDCFKMTGWSIMIFVLLIMSFMLTVMYSARATWYLMNSSKNWHCMSDGDFGMILPMLPLASLASFGGSASSWLLAEESFYIETSKVLVLILLVLASFSYWKCREVTTVWFLESKWNLSTFNCLMSKLFFHSSITYKYSSDLMGLPEVLSKTLKMKLKLNSFKIMSTMVNYLSYVELLVFLLFMILIT